MRLGLNLVYLRPGQVGGSEVYSRHLVRYLSQLHKNRLTLFVGTYGAPVFAQQSGVELVTITEGPYSRGRRLLTENIRLLAALRQHPVDVLFSPGNIAAPLLPYPVPQVVTIHDLQHLQHPEYFSFMTLHGREALMRTSAVRCRRVIAVSRFTGDDVARRYGIGSEKLRVVHEAVERDLRPAVEAIEAVRREFALEERFFIYPATTLRHKNHLGLLDSFSRFAAKPGNEKVQLAFVGRRTEYWPTIEQEIVQLGASNMVRHLGFVERHELVSLVAAAEALVFPSEFEGFGLPVLEAMACNTPVIASDHAAIPEVAGDAALLVSPYDRDAWVEAMQRVLDDAELRRSLVSRGRENIRRFSWKRCAQETLEVLEEAAS